MSRAATAPTKEPATQSGSDEFSRLISRNARIGQTYKVLSAAEENIEAMLPQFMKGQAQRLIRRALITLSKSPDLEGITDEAFRRCVVEAAEMGFAIDGRLCYVVKYKNTYQLQLDYKAVVAVAKRNRTIRDLDADVVRAGDHFRHGKYGGKNVLEHTFDVTADRGDVVAAYCRVFLPDGSWSYEVMSRSQLDAVQRRAPAQNGPWKTDPDEMRKKTVIRRKLKLYQDDPGLMRLLEITAVEDDYEPEQKPKTLDELRAAVTQSLAGIGGEQHEPFAAEPRDSSADRDSLMERAFAAFQVMQDEPGVDFELASLLNECQTDGDRDAVKGLAAERKAAIRKTHK